MKAARESTRDNVSYSVEPCGGGVVAAGAAGGAAGGGGAEGADGDGAASEAARAAMTTSSTGGAIGEPASFACICMQAQTGAAAMVPQVKAA